MVHTIAHSCVAKQLGRRCDLDCVDQDRDHGQPAARVAPAAKPPAAKAARSNAARQQRSQTATPPRSSISSHASLSAFAALR